LNIVLNFFESIYFFDLQWQRFIVASIVLTLSPGPDIIYVVIQSMANGKKRGIAISLGLVSGIIIHTTLVAFGVALIIKQNDFLFLILKTIGSFYLIFLAFQVYSSDSKIDIKMSEKNSSTFFESYQKGFVMNVLNPKVTMFFLAFLPCFLDKNSYNIVADTYFLGFLFMFQAIIIFVGVSFMADKLALHLRNNSTFNQLMKWVQIIVFLCLAGLLWFT